MRIREICGMLLLFFTANCHLSAQVTYDSNAVVIAALPNTSFVQDTFTVPAGTDRLLVAFVMRDGNNTVSDSITFNSQHLTRQLQVPTGNAGLNVELWYMTQGCGPGTTDSLKAYFHHAGGGNLPDIIVAAATFQNVNQFSVFGAFAWNFGSGGSSSPLNLNTADTNGLLIGSVGTDINSGLVTIMPTGSNQIEIYETSIPGNNNSAEGSIKATTGGTDVLQWAFSTGCNWFINAVELLASDSDGDGVPDCNDLCPMDSLKSDPGICGCGVSDIDTDGDGTVDCNDLCPLDSLKTDPGICGCGVVESLVDTDGDGTVDCIDLCPFDSLKIDPGICGCGVPDLDTDGDGTVDCIDDCPNDPTLIADVDSDNDGVADCADPCPYDSLKVDPGLCGCGITDVDSDMDGIPDCAEEADVQIHAEDNVFGKGPVLHGLSVSQMGDSTGLWSLGNRTGLDSALTFMQHRQDDLHFGAGNTIHLTLDTHGSLGIGLQPGSHQLEVNGQASKSTPGNWLANSDARLKKDILPLDPKETLSKLLQLRGVTYTWNDSVTGLTRPNGIQYGLLAQDIQKVFPQLVIEDSKGYLQTSYGTFDPMILEGIRFIHSELRELLKESAVMMKRLDVIEKGKE